MAECEFKTVKYKGETYLRLIDVVALFHELAGSAEADVAAGLKEMALRLVEAARKAEK